MVKDTEVPPRSFVEVRTTLARRGVRSEIIYKSVECMLDQQGKLVTEIGGVKLRPGQCFADEADTLAMFNLLCESRPEMKATVMQQRALDAAQEPMRRMQREAQDKYDRATGRKP